MQILGIVLCLTIGGGVALIVMLTLQKERVVTAAVNLQKLAADLQQHLQERTRLRREISAVEADIAQLRTSLTQLTGERDAVEVAFGQVVEPFTETRCVNTAEAVVFGRGSQWVYAYTFPAHEHLAWERREPRYPMKIGMSTQDNVVTRVHQQVAGSSTAISERAVLRLVFRVNDAGHFERWMHARLGDASRKVSDSVGVEWYRTNPDELQHLFRSYVLTNSRANAPAAGERVPVT